MDKRDQQAACDDSIAHAESANAQGIVQGQGVGEETEVGVFFLQEDILGMGDRLPRLQFRQPLGQPGTDHGFRGDGHQPAVSDDGQEVQKKADCDNGYTQMAAVGPNEDEQEEIGKDKKDTR